MKVFGTSNKQEQEHRMEKLLDEMQKKNEALKVAIEEKEEREAAEREDEEHQKELEREMEALAANKKVLSRELAVIENRIKHMVAETETVGKEIVGYDQRTRKILEARQKKIEWERKLMEDNKAQQEQNERKKCELMRKAEERSKKISLLRLQHGKTEERIEEEKEEEMSESLKQKIAFYEQLASEQKLLEKKMYQPFKVDIKGGDRDKRIDKREKLDHRYREESSLVLEMDQKLEKLKRIEGVMVEEKKITQQNRNILKSQLQDVLKKKLEEGEIREILSRDKQFKSPQSRKFSVISILNTTENSILNSKKARSPGTKLSFAKNVNLGTHTETRKKAKEQQTEKENPVLINEKNIPIKSQGTKPGRSSRINSPGRGIPQLKNSVPKIIEKQPKLTAVKLTPASPKSSFGLSTNKTLQANFQRSPKSIQTQPSTKKFTPSIAMPPTPKKPSTLTSLKLTSNLKYQPSSNFMRNTVVIKTPKTAIKLEGSPSKKTIESKVSNSTKNGTHKRLENVTNGKNSIQIEEQKCVEQEKNIESHNPELKEQFNEDIHQNGQDSPKIIEEDNEMNNTQKEESLNKSDQVQIEDDDLVDNDKFNHQSPLQNERGDVPFEEPQNIDAPEVSERNVQPNDESNKDLIDDFETEQPISDIPQVTHESVFEDKNEGKLSNQIKSDDECREDTIDQVEEFKAEEKVDNGIEEGVDELTQQTDHNQHGNDSGRQQNIEEVDMTSLNEPEELQILEDSPEVANVKEEKSEKSAKKEEKDEIDESGSQFQIDSIIDEGSGNVEKSKGEQSFQVEGYSPLGYQDNINEIFGGEKNESPSENREAALHNEERNKFEESNLNAPNEKNEDEQENPKSFKEADLSQKEEISRNDSESNFDLKGKMN